jgi:hypothetical protein
MMDLACEKETNFKKTKKMILDQMEILEKKLWNVDLKKARAENQKQDLLLRQK